MRSTVSVLLALPILSLSACSARAVNPSASKLAPHLIQNYTAGTRQILAAHPRVIKVLDVYGPMMDAVRDYKRDTPNGIVVLRIYTARAYTRNDNPATSAANFWQTVLAPAVNILSPADRALIDYLEGPNECDSTPCWSSVQDAQWFNDFWMALAPLIADAGFRPCAFSIPVGNPPGDEAQRRQILDAIVPSLRLCKQLGGGWSYHSYTHAYTTDLGEELWYSLRYRQYYAYFRERYPDLADLPLILTEGGMDSGGHPVNSGWQAHGDAAKYQNWLTWFDDQLRQDPYVIGCTLFQIGTPNWPSFELEPIAGWLANHLNVSIPPVIVCSPQSLSTRLVNGRAADLTFTVGTSAPDSTLNYTVTRDAGWISVSPAGGTSRGESDPITVTLNASGLAPGFYSGTVQVSDAAADNSPQTITVQMTVTSSVVGDFDGDRDVDAADFEAFFKCLSGPGVEPSAGLCELKDLDFDRDVDQVDFGIFQRCLSGSGLQAGPGCAL